MKSGERVVGRPLPASTQVGHLFGMAVVPDFQGTGVAGKLLAEIEYCLHSQGCRQITLDTTEPLTAAMKFYERHGYGGQAKSLGNFSSPPQSPAVQLPEIKPD